MVEVSTLTYNLCNFGFWMCSTGWFKQNCFRSQCWPNVAGGPARIFTSPFECQWSCTSCPIGDGGRGDSSNTRKKTFFFWGRVPLFQRRICKVWLCKGKGTADEKIRDGGGTLTLLTLFKQLSSRKAILPLYNIAELLHGLLSKMWEWVDTGYPLHCYDYGVPAVQYMRKLLRRRKFFLSKLRG